MEKEKKQSKVNTAVTVKCSDCRGSGWNKDNTNDCSTCQGTGVKD